MKEKEKGREALSLKALVRGSKRHAIRRLRSPTALAGKPTLLSLSPVSWSAARSVLWRFFRVSLSSREPRIEILGRFAAAAVPPGPPPPFPRLIFHNAPPRITYAKGPKARPIFRSFKPGSISTRTKAHGPVLIRRVN